MENKGCAFEIKGGGKPRYFASPAVERFTDFARFLYENRENGDYTPRPLSMRIPETVELKEAEWHEIADHRVDGYSCFIGVDIPENVIWVNENAGDGMALYCFSLTAVMEEAASDTEDIWERLLLRYPNARMC